MGLPPHAYLPGQSPRHPEDFFDDVRASVAAGLTVSQLEQSRAWTFGWVLFREEFYWEAHEVWEPVWMHLPDQSRERLFVQACIQLANALLKEKMQRFSAAERISDLVHGYLRACPKAEIVMGVPVQEVFGILGDLDMRLISKV